MMVCDVTLPLVSALLLSVLQFSECRTYHLAFLGRNITTSSTVGSIVATTSALLGAPSFNVTHSWSDCLVFSIDYPDFLTTMMDVSVSNPCSSFVPNGTGITNTGLKIEAEDEGYELHVYQTDSKGIRGDGFLAISDEYLGSTYYVLTYCSTGGVCQFAVTAVNNNTALNVMFPKNVTTTTTCIDGLPISETAPSGSNVPIMLQEFQVLHVESLEDLSGTFIVADKHVSVIVGSRDVPDYIHGETTMIEQVPPVNRWGTEFVVAPNYQNLVGDLIKIVSKEDNTVVHIQGLSPFTMSSRGDVVERRIEWELHSRILTSHPVLIMQIMSVDLYNDTSNVYGSPSMVLVPHINQWTDVMEYYCFQSGIDPIITMVAASTTSGSIPIQPSPTLYHNGGWDAIPVTKYSVLSFTPFANETKITLGPQRSAYAHCNKRSAVLLAADWTYENQECVRTSASPGDEKDNDCDGEIDEEICQLDFTFVAEQNSDGTLPYKTLNIHGINSVHFGAQTCQIAMIKLQSSLNPAMHFTLHMAATGFDDLGTSIHLFNVSDCSVSHNYTLEWTELKGLMIHTLTVDSADIFTWNVTDSPGIDYDTLILSAMLGQAEFHTHLYETDCKFTTEYKDNFGSHFLVPVQNTDSNFGIYIVTGSEACTVDFSVSFGPLMLANYTTKWITHSILAGTGYSNGIILTAVDCEISVYLERQITADDVIYTRLLPTDILGPKYMLYGTDAINTNNTTNPTGCEVWPIFDDYLVFSDLFNITYGDVGSITDIDADYLNMQHKWESDHVVAVFCGDFIDTMVQMPPLSALGTKFFIPKLDLGLLNVVADIYVIMSEDSTVVTIKGDYDQITAINYTGDIFMRPVVSETLYDIESTKPIQVHLALRSDSDNWASVIIIPPTSQYKNVHVFPGLKVSLYSITLSRAVDDNGNAVTSNVVAGVPPANASSSKQLQYLRPTFSLTFVQRVSGISRQIVITSDTYYNVTNEVCHLTKGTPGDLIDNDCDGLTDEENCSAVVYPGYIDIDIDGSLADDCAANTSSAVEITLYIPSDVPECANYTSEPEVEIGITVGGTNISYDNVIVPTTSSPDTPPTFAPVEQPHESVIIEGIPTGPIETCETDCICPCGWLEPQNYTLQEIEDVVEQIQEKLKVSKEQLSSTIRKKTSAPDDRTSAQAVGFVGLGFMIVFLSSIVLLDMSTLVREIKILFNTVRDYCRGS